MQRTLLSWGYSATVFFLTLIPLISRADDAPPPASGGTDKGLSYGIGNILKFDTLEDLLTALIKIIIVIAVPIIVLFIIYAGFKYVTAQGNPTKIQEATRTLTYAVIGGVIIIGAFAIAQIIGGFVKSFTLPG